MRRPKHRLVRRGREEHTHDFVAHAPSTAFVRVSVTETTQSVMLQKLNFAGALIVELERISGPVIVRWTDAYGKPQEMILTNKEG